MNIHKIDSENPDLKILQQAGNIVKSGGIVIYPTETLYGIGGNPFDETVIEKIYRLKKRDLGKPFHCIISGIDSLKEVSKELPALFYMLIERFWPGPLTLIIKRIKTSQSESELRNCGIRIPSGILSQKLTEYSEGILISTSANISGEKSPRSLNDIHESLLNNTDIVLDGGEIISSDASTVLNLTTDIPTVIREGAISKREIEELIGPVS